MWIAAIQREKVTKPDGTVEDRDAMCREVLGAAKAKSYEIATSGLSLVEVCKERDIKDGKAGDDEKIADFFHNDYILIVNVDKYIGTVARQLMMAGYDGLKPPDATHLATAIVSQSTELHTFDEKLLKLDGEIDRLDGGKLKICHPNVPKMPAAPLPLLEGIGDE